MRIDVDATVEVNLNDYHDKIKEYVLENIEDFLDENFCEKMKIFLDRIENDKQSLLNSLKDYIEEFKEIGFDFSMRDLKEFSIGEVKDEFFGLTDGRVLFVKIKDTFNIANRKNEIVSIKKLNYLPNSTGREMLKTNKFETYLKKENGIINNIIHSFVEKNGFNYFKVECKAN